MKLRMGSALLSLSGIFVAAYLWLYKQGRIGSIICGTGGCETVQFSRWATNSGPCSGRITVSPSGLR